MPIGTGFDRAARFRLVVGAVVCLAATHVGSVVAQAPASPSVSPQSASPPSASPPIATSGALSGPSAAPAVKPAVPDPPSDAANPTPEHIAKARQLILATGISRSFQIIIPEFMDQIGNSLTQSRPDLVGDMNKVLIELRPEFDRQSDEMIDQSARIYATLLSEKDIDAVLAFFNSEAGRKYVGAQPLFLNQLVSGMQAWQQKISTIMMARVREEMKKKGHDL